ncbi:MAG: di-trans,poly-cis-decaprenylcistransferase [Candidatus Omnitrophica bacterium]|nr:di-trans,poly-cis-decaprenylcistransferase [Candidatus Omnitrophota bacterium]
MCMLEKNNLPRHIAIIMDGNGRWAKMRGLPRVMGHKVGIESVRVIVKECVRLNVEVLTLYAFSAENWKRPRKEVETLMRFLHRKEVETLMRFLHKFLQKEIDELNSNNIRLNAIGRWQELPPFVRDRLMETIAQLKDNTGLILNLALNYGGRSEIVDGIKGIVRDIREGRVDEEDINEEMFCKYLYTANLPDPDLLIRTSGEMRVSNFLLYQISYSEIYVTSKLWPDFRKEDLDKAIMDYQKRIRRYGGV